MARILIIDDVAENRELICSLLGHFGHKMFEARDGEKGLEIVQAEKPELVIVDIVMPTMSGYEFVTRLRHDPAIAATRVIFYSATFLQEETHALARACGVSRVLAKSSDPGEILGVVSAVLAEAGGVEPASFEAPRSAVEVVQVLNNRLFQKNKELLELNERLEQIVSERTAELRDANERLKEQIVERQKAEEDLRQIQKLEGIGRLAGGVAHDFNNLLGVILGRCEILLGLSSLDAEVLRGLKLIGEAAESGARLTRQLLAFGRQQVLAPTILDLNEVVANLQKLLQRLIGEDVELQFQPDPDLAPILADASQLERVIMNLAVNARDAMPRGGRLTLATENQQVDETYADRHVTLPPGAYVALTVSDSGYGMDAETQSHIFEPFFTTKERGKGTGLGLATVYGIVKQSGGYIWAYSEPGLGTTFKIYLPRGEGQMQIPLTSRAAELPLRGSETVLLVEDDPALRELTREFLQNLGYCILEAGTPKEALLAAAHHPGPIHVLLTDCILPGINGHALATELRAARPSVKVLYMSGYADETVIPEELLKEGSAFLQKPFSCRVLTQKIREILGEAHAGSEAAASAGPAATSRNV